MEAEGRRTLLDRARAGDPEALVELLESCANRIGAALRRAATFGNADDFREAQDEATLQIVRSFGTYRAIDGAEICTWMYSVAYKVGAQFSRAQTRRKRAVEAASTDHRIARQLDEPVQADADLLRQADRELVRKVVARLSDDHRRVLLMHEVDGLSYDEIADILMIAPATVGSRLNRAKRAALQLYRELDDDDG